MTPFFVARNKEHIMVNIYSILTILLLRKKKKKKSMKKKGKECYDLQLAVSLELIFFVSVTDKCFMSWFRRPDADVLMLMLDMAKKKKKKKR